MKAVRTVCIGDFLNKSQNWVEPEPDQTYKQITARLWGKGLTLRAEVSGSQIAAARQLQVKAGQFLVSRIDARHGAFGIIPMSLDGALVSNDFPCFDIDSKVALPAYFAWYTRTENFIALCRRASEGSTNRVRLKENEFLRMTISLPPLAEQRRIVAKLDKVAALVEEAKSLRQEIDREMRSLVQSVHFELSDVSEHPFGEFIELWEDRVPIDPTERYPQVGVRGFAGGLFFKDAIQGSETKYKTFNRLSEGLLVVSQPKGWEGAVAVCDASHEGWYVSPEYRTFCCNPALLYARYLAALLPTPWFQRELTKLTRGQGARRERLRPEMLLNMKIRMPALEAQKAALQSFGKLRDLRAVRADAEENVEALLPAMLHGVFNGRGIDSFTHQIASSTK